VDPHDLRGEVQGEIRRILADPGMRAARLMGAIGDLGAVSGVEPYRACLRALVPVDRSDGAARILLEEIEAHRARLETSLARDPGLSVAALDYLHDLEGTLGDPVFREQAVPQPEAAPAGSDLVSASLDEVLALEMRRSERFGHPMALALLAPDAGGVGEDLLSAASEALRKAIRDTDHAARLLPDGFALVLPCAGEEEAVKTADRHRPGLSAATGVTWSCGVASCPDRPWEPRALAGAARRALDSAREAGGNAVRPYRAERREHPRRSVGPSIAAVLRAEGPDLPVQVLDLSIGGSLLLTSRRIDPGSRILLAIREASARPREVVLSSRVVRSEATSVPSPDGPAWRSGVAFLADVEARCRVAGILTDAARVRSGGEPGA